MPYITLTKNFFFLSLLALLSLNNSAFATQLTGSVALPNGDIANDLIFLELRIRETGQNLTYPVNTSSLDLEIASGASKVEYSIEIPELNSGTGYEVSIRCFRNCLGYLNQYLQSDGVSLSRFPQEVSAENLPTVVNLELAKGEVLSGTINIPDSISLDDATINASLVLLDNDSGTQETFEGNVTFSTVDQSLPFSITYVPVSNGLFELSFSCNGTSRQTCQTLQEHVSLIDGEIIVSENLFDRLRPFDQLPASPVHINYPAGNTLELNIDVGAPREDFTWFELKIETLDISRDIVQTDADSITISQGESQGAVFTTYKTPQNNEVYHVRLRCISGCTGLQRETFVNQAGELVVTPTQLSNLPDELNLVVPKTTVATAHVSLPQGSQAIEDIDVIVEVDVSRADNGDQIEFITPTQQPVILAGTNSASFEIEILNPTARVLSVRYQCDNSNPECGSSYYDQSHYFTPKGVEFNFNRRLFSAEQLPEVFNLTLFAPTKINGSLIIPSGKILAEPTSVFVSINLGDQNNNSYNETVSIDLAANTQSQPFSISLPPADFRNIFRLTVGCGLPAGCTNLFGERFFAPSGITPYRAGSFPFADLPNPLEIEIPIGSTYTNTIQLPNNELATETLQVGIELTAYDSGGAFLSLESINAQIAVGENSTQISVPYENNNAAFFTVSVGCQANCGDFIGVGTAYITPSNLKLIESNAAITREELFSLASLELTRGSRITGEVELPAGISGLDFPDTPASVSLNAQLLDKQGNILKTVSSDFAPFYKDSSTTTDFDLLIPPLGDQSVVLSYSCPASRTGCENIVSQNYYSNGRVVHNSSEADLIGSEGLTNLVLPLITSASSTTISTSRSENNRDLNLWASLKYVIDIIDISGNVTNSVEVNDFIFSGSTDSFSIAVNLPQTNGSINVRVQCIATAREFVDSITNDCSSFVEGDSSYTASFAAADIPANIRFVLIDTIEPDLFEPDNTASEALVIRSSIEQNRSIHEPGDQDWISFSLEQSESINIEAISSNISDGKPSVELLRNDLTVIENNDSVISQRELSADISLIERKNLAAGDYFVKISGFSDTSNISAYSLKIDLPNDELCVPIASKNGRMALICL